MDKRLTKFVSLYITLTYNLFQIWTDVRPYLCSPQRLKMNRHKDRKNERAAKDMVIRPLCHSLHPTITSQPFLCRTSLLRTAQCCRRCSTLNTRMSAAPCAGYLAPAVCKIMSGVVGLLT